MILCYCFDMILLCLEFITMFYCYFSMHTLTYNHICMYIYTHVHIYIHLCIIFYIVIQLYYYRWCDTCIYIWLAAYYAYTVLLNILNLSSYFLGDWAIQPYKSTPLSRGNAFFCAVQPLWASQMPMSVFIAFGLGFFQNCRL